MRSGDGHDDDADVPAGDGEEPQPEPAGLEAVDAAPLAPLTRDEIEAMRAERDDLRDQLLRRRADFDNYKKRVERDRAQAGVDALAAFLRELVPTIDNLDRALEAAGGESSLREGVELTRRDLLGLLAAQGVELEDPKGQPFDPLRHQALSHESVPGFPEGTVVEVFRKGYSFKGRLLRPALVKVAKGPAQAGLGPGGEGESRPESVH